MPKILLADENFNFRSALKLVLETRFSAREIAEAGDMEQVERQILDEPPGCIIFDWDLPGQFDRNNITRLRCLAPAASIVISSTKPEVREASKVAKADAFIDKGQTPAEIIHLIQSLCTDREKE